MTKLTREDALKWNPRWSEADRRQIDADFDVVGAASFYQPTSGGYLGVKDATGRRRMYVAPGYAWFVRGAEPAGRELPGWNGYELSTFQPRGDGAPSSSREERFCPMHHIALPLTGRCDDCE